MTPRVLALSLGFLGISCSSSTGDFTPPTDVPTSDVSQDVPSDASPQDVASLDVPSQPDVLRLDVSAQDTGAPDTGAQDAGSPDVGTVDVGTVDAMTVDAAIVDVAVGDGGACGAPGAAAAVCGAAMCGNGRIDTCRTCGACDGARPFLPDAGTRPPPPDGGSCCTDTAERCDGAELSGSTCVSLGYPGGTLGCGAACDFDTSNCEVCATGPSIAQCGRVRVAAIAPRELALATTGSRVGLAWVSAPASDGTGGALGFASLTSTLAVNFTNPCLRSGVTHVALSATSAGWMLAAQHATGVDLYALDADGAVAGPTRFIGNIQSPLLSASPDGHVLLVYTVYGASGASVLSSVLNADGSPASPSATLLGDVTEPEYGSVVSTGDGWLVAMRERGIAVVRVGADGRAGVVAHPTSNDTEYPQIGWNGTFATLTWTDFGASPGAVRYGRLDTAGALVGTPLTLGSIPTYYNVSPTVAVGADTMVLLSGYSGGTGRARRLDLQRVSAAGAVTASPIALTAGPELHVNYRVATLGTDVVAAWLAADGVPGRITLARVRP